MNRKQLVILLVLVVVLGGAGLLLRQRQSASWQPGNAIKSLLLGKKHMKKADRPSPYGAGMGDEGWPDGRYVKVGGDSENVALSSDALANLEPKPEQWLNKDFFKVEKPRAIAVAFPVATNSWKLSRETESAEWKLAEAKPAEQLDSSKASGV